MSKQLSPKYRNYINSDQWRKGWRRGLTMRLLFGRDAICPLLKAHHADHLHYKNLTHELPLRDLVPLNKTMHLRIVTPLRSCLRFILGRSLGNALLAWILRAFVLGWQGAAIWAIVKIYQTVRTIC
jgi:hypothetical protein